MHPLLQYIRAAIPTPAPADVPDRELLERFVQSRDEASFAALVGRHGGGVWATCRRLVDREQDAEDAFQAVLLTLAHKAGSIRGQDALPAWLHGVARRITANLRRDKQRRVRAEGAAARRLRVAAEDLTWREGLSVLDEELGRLPQRYRVVLIVCCLDGWSRDEAAAQLGWSPGQVKGRLERARQLLGRRLARRGFDLGGSLLAVTAARSAPAGVTPALVSATVRAAVLVAASQGTIASGASAQVAVLTEGVLHAMFMKKIKVMTAVLLAIVIAGGGLLACRTALSGPESITRETKGQTKATGSGGAAVAGQKKESDVGNKAAGASGAKKEPLVEAKIDLIGAGHTAMEIVKATKDPDAKWMAIRILGNLRYEPAIPLLLAALSDPHPYVRSNAARALGDMRVAAAGKPLTEMLKGEANGGVIQQTSLALANLRHLDALPVLKAAAKHPDVQTRMWVLQAVGRLGGKRDVAFLAHYLLNDPSSSVQRSAAEAIEQITGADFGFPRRSGPSGPDEGLRRARTWWEEHKGEY
jgi:RNA polymerase sigma factor (sigma-70 family)